MRGVALHGKRPAPSNGWRADLDEEKQPELRDGHSGAGVYDKDDWRIDLGDPDDP